MFNFKQQTFDGTLLDLFEILRGFIPDLKHLIKGQDWILSQPGKSKVLPIRQFAGHRIRGELFTSGEYTFCPIDNELLAEFYDNLRRGNIPHDDLWSLVERGDLSISWYIKPNVRKSLGHNIRVAPARTSFRDNGILLAHIFDAAAQINGADEKTGLLRYHRSLNPINIFPWPGHRRTYQKIITTDHSWLAEFRCNPADLSSHPGIQLLMAAFMSEIIEDSQATSNWLSTSNGDLERLKKADHWREVASQIKVRIEPKTAAHRTRAGDPVQNTRGIGFQRGLRFSSFLEFIDEFRAWSEQNEPITQLDGGNGKNRTRWITFSINSFANSQISVPRYNRQNRILEHVMINANEFNGIYQLNGDTKIDVLNKFATRIDLPDIEDDLIDLLEPCLTKAGTKKLNIRGTNGARGFYCLLYRRQ